MAHPSTLLGKVPEAATHRLPIGEKTPACSLLGSAVCIPGGHFAQLKFC